MSTAHLICPAQGIRIGLGKPRRGPDGTVTGFTGRPGTDYTRALWKFITDCTTGDLTVTLGRQRPALVARFSANRSPHREIGGPASSGGIPFPDYLDAADRDHITYYALLFPGFTRENPSGLVRRRHREIGLRGDEVFTRNDRWEPTEYLVRYNLGHNDIDHVEISEDEATAFVLHCLAKKL